MISITIRIIFERRCDEAKSKQKCRRQSMGTFRKC
jgi:hypothetical protein